MSTVHVEPRNHLLAFVALHHAQQKRKYTDEPYLNHLQAVAKMADGTCRLGYEIGLSHDLLEDTSCEPHELFEALNRFGYCIDECKTIMNAVIALTDIYTSEAFPQLNRAKRKEEEAKRLWHILYEAQTVKYCDLMHNTESIVKYDPGFAVKYLNEKTTILKGMNKGNPIIYKKCQRTLKKALKLLNAK